MAPGFDHGVLEADLTHVDVRHPRIAALVVQLRAAPPDPAGGLAELLACRAMVLRLRSPIAGKVSDRERAMPQKARPDLDAGDGGVVGAAGFAEDGVGDDAGLVFGDVGEQGDAGDVAKGGAVGGAKRKRWPVRGP